MATATSCSSVTEAAVRRSASISTFSTAPSAVSRYSIPLSEISRATTSRSTLSIRKLSGVTSPATTASPSPQEASMATCDRSPVVGFRVKATPEATGSTIFCTPTDMAMEACR